MMSACSGRPRASSRKRRAASLTAEYLWNIQMEDSACRSNESSGVVPTTEKTGMPLQHNTHHRNQSVGALCEKSGVCVHFPKHRDNLSCSNSNKNRPTASVLPVVQSEAKQELKRSDSLQNSQILLLPVSLNAGEASLPVFALRSSSLEVDLAKYVSHLNPIINVVPMMKKPAVNTRTKNAPMCFPICSDGYSPDNANATCQLEPLNLKLGESSIPSNIQVDRKEETRPKDSHVHALIHPCHVPINKEWTSNLLFSRGKNRPTPISNCGTTYPNQDLNERLNKESANFSAYSPSSESSCSTDNDAGSVVGSKQAGGRRKPSINLRGKAAPASYDVGSSKFHQMRKYSDNNNWIWDGEPYDSLVFSMEIGKPVMRRCFPTMRRKSESSLKHSLSSHDDDDVIMVHDCVVMRSDPNERPYIAKVAALWQHPSTYKMMISLLWFYRPEHTQDLCTEDFADAELFASRHLDEISVACVEDKCYVLTFSQYCRCVAEYVAGPNHIGSDDGRNLVPSHHTAVDSVVVPPDVDISLVYFCRKTYDIKSHRLLKSFPVPSPLFNSNIFYGSL